MASVETIEDPEDPRLRGYSDPDTELTQMSRISVQPDLSRVTSRALLMITSTARKKTIGDLPMSAIGISHEE
jgi:hypothetical protein